MDVKSELEFAGLQQKDVLNTLAPHYRRMRKPLLSEVCNRESGCTLTSQAIKILRKQYPLFAPVKRENRARQHRYCFRLSNEENERFELLKQRFEGLTTDEIIRRIILDECCRLGV